MEILYFFQEKETPMYQWQRLHFIDELSHHGVNFYCINPLAYSTAAEANEALIDYVNKHSFFDLFMTNIGFDHAIFPETIRYIKKKGIPTLCFRSDNLTIPYIDKVSSPLFDLVWLTSSDTQYMYDKWGAKTLFMPYAANPFFFKFNEPQSLNRTVCFIGTPYGSRPIMINKLTGNGLDVDVYYKKNAKLQVQEVRSTLKSEPVLPSKTKQLISSLTFKEGRSVLRGMILNKLKGQYLLVENDCLHSFPSVLPDEQTTIYSDHVLCLSSTSSRNTDALRNPLQVLNLRAFEVPMCGGIQICRYNKELSGYFEEDKEIVFYRDENELVDKVLHYTQKVKDSDIIRMKIAARSRAEREHTWWNRFAKAFDVLGIRY